ncbi:alpha-hydroxy acid oxidase [Chitinasiproducens palmae]|uniref:(S)-mandelate dehydrogenase n=1 Tax=Chitinasiproducens palmae TaxID=1770053 RepID=A0A1H2PNJ0_9BURK|nr:alpha-hydroxy acid oxidase [Chitinasiproducens palmae]SDV47737.1 (S)-mandelate dehydrogenase [Chitinasiproducens palmae]
MRANVFDYQLAAERFLPAFAYGYLEGGAEQSVTMRRNRRAFEETLFAPRVGVDVSVLDTTTRVADRPLAWPAIVGPTGLNGLFRHRAEESLARQAHAAGLPFALSTASTSLIESVREASNGDLWLQLYVQRDRRIAEDMMRRARACDFSTLLLTVDTAVSGQRDHYRRTGFTLPIRWTPRMIWDVASHPRWCGAVGLHGIPKLVNLARSAGLSGDLAEQAAAMSREMDMSLSWGDLAWVRRHWPGRIFVKGVQRVADAQLAVAHGADGIVLSNHGGRQLDGVPSPLEMLQETVAALPSHVDVIVDGGIRRGSDIVKAVALGARAVLLGRAPLYGLAAEGETGCADVLALLRQELHTCLRLLGCPRVAALDPTYLAAVPHLPTGVSGGIA